MARAQGIINRLTDEINRLIDDLSRTDVVVLLLGFFLVFVLVVGAFLPGEDNSWWKAADAPCRAAVMLVAPRGGYPLPWTDVMGAAPRAIENPTDDQLTKIMLRSQSMKFPEDKEWHRVSCTFDLKAGTVLSVRLEPVTR